MAQKPQAVTLNPHQHPIVSTALLGSTTTVGNTAVPIPAAALAGRMNITVYNNGSNTVFLGGSVVAAGTGLPLGAGASYSLTLSDDSILYGITSSSTSDVRSLEA